MGQRKSSISDEWLVGLLGGGLTILATQGNISHTVKDRGYQKSAGSELSRPADALSLVRGILFL